MWGNEIACQPLTDALDKFFEHTDPLEPDKLSEDEIRAGISRKLKQVVLSSKDIKSLEQARPNFTSNNYVQGKFGFYTTLEGFLASRRCVRLAKKGEIPSADPPA